MSDSESAGVTAADAYLRRYQEIMSQHERLKRSAPGLLDALGAVEVQFSDFQHLAVDFPEASTLQAGVRIIGRAIQSLTDYLEQTGESSL